MFPRSPGLICLFPARSMGSPEQNWEEEGVPLPCTLLPSSLCCPSTVLPHIAEARIGRYIAPYHSSILALWQPSPSIMALFPYTHSLSHTYTLWPEPWLKTISSFAITFWNNMILIPYFPSAPKCKVLPFPRLLTLSYMAVPVAWISDSLLSIMVLVTFLLHTQSVCVPKTLHQMPTGTRRSKQGGKVCTFNI